MISAGVTGKLGEIVGTANVLAGADETRGYATDASGRACAASIVVVLPGGAGEVAAVVRLAGDEGLPVVPRGGGTGLRGGAVPLRGGIVLSTERMKPEIEIHREDLYVVAGAGVVTGDLIRRVEDQGLFFPIDPASAESSTVGGNVADSAVGMHGIKYCSMRNYVLGLEMVMPDGNMLKVGAKMVKSVAGYDLARLMVGAQGIMGIVTSATLKVLPMPEDRRVLVFEFPDGAGAAAAAQEMIDEGLGPAALEIADPLTVGAARGAPEDACRAELLVEFHGTKSLCEGDASEVKAMVMARPEASAAAEAGYPEALNLWKVRRSALAALAATWPALLLMDLALPRGRMEGMVKEIDEISKRHRTRIAVFGHAGEGRLHAAVPADGAAEDAVSEITNACVNWGGVVSAEMGTGLRAARLPRASLSETGREVLGILKRSIDPEGMMNPGKLLDEG